MNHTEPGKPIPSIPRNRTPSADGQGVLDESRRFEQLIIALDQAGTAVNQASTKDAIFSSMEQALKQLGFSCMLWLADRNQGRLSPAYFSQGAQAIRAAEKLTGFREEDFSVPIESVDLFEEVIKEEQTVFVIDSLKVAQQILPQHLRNHAQAIVDIFEAPRAINVPLRVEGEVIGLFSVQSDVLTEKDIPAIDAFANQFSASWRIAQLYEQAQRENVRRRQAEELLRRREREFNVLVENSPDAIARLDREGRYQYVNLTRARHFGRSASEIQGRTWWDLLGSKEAEKGKLVDAARKEVFSNSRECTLEHQINTPDGPRWLQSQGIPEFAEDGSVESMLVVTRDITKRKQAEDALQRSAEQLHELSNRLNETLEAERRSIARELHDEIGQVIATVKANLEGLLLASIPGTMRPPIENSIRSTECAIEKVRALSLDLRPSLLDDFGLQVAVEWYLKNQIETAGLAVQLQSNLSERRLPTSIETAAFRVVQAALTNTQLHARARCVKVRLQLVPASSETPPELGVSVCDEGWRNHHRSHPTGR